MPSNTTGTQRPQRNRSATPAAPPTPTAPSSTSAPHVPSTGGNGREGKAKLGGPEIFQKYNSAVFMIYTTDGRNYYQGSGFFLNHNGLGVSNYHVFEGTAIGREEILLIGSDKVYKVSEVIQRSKDEDFILFQVDVSNTNYIPIAKSKPLVGERVYALGSPQGLQNTFSSGEVSQLRGKNIIQTSVPIDHGSSGGALINEYGEVVGITKGSYDEDSGANLNVAVSIEVIKPYINIR